MRVYYGVDLISTIESVSLLYFQAKLIYVLIYSFFEYQITSFHILANLNHQIAHLKLAL